MTVSDSPSVLRYLGKGVNDPHRRCQSSERANERHADTLSAAKVSETLQMVAAPACNQDGGIKGNILSGWMSRGYLRRFP